MIWNDIFMLIVVGMQGEFAEDGTETHFVVATHNCCIKALSSGRRRSGLIHVLLVDGDGVPEFMQWAGL